MKSYSSRNIYVTLSIKTDEVHLRVFGKHPDDDNDDDDDDVRDKKHHLLHRRVTKWICVIMN